MQQLIGGPQQRGMCPVIDCERAPGVPRERYIEVGRCPERAVYDLCSKRRVDAADRTTPELGIEGRGRPRIVARNPVKHASRDLSGDGYHGAKLTRVARAGTEIGAAADGVIP